MPRRIPGLVLLIVDDGEFPVRFVHDLAQFLGLSARPDHRLLQQDCHVVFQRQFRLFVVEVDRRADAYDVDSEVFECRFERIVPAGNVELPPEVRDALLVWITDGNEVRIGVPEADDGGTDRSHIW